MRAIAVLLLGLFALVAARPVCAWSTPAPAMAQAGHQSHEGCPPPRDRAAHQGCAMAACAGCGLGVTQPALPASPATSPPAPRPVALARPLAGLGPVAAIPPPRPLA